MRRVARVGWVALGLVSMSLGCGAAADGGAVTPEREDQQSQRMLTATTAATGVSATATTATLSTVSTGGIATIAGGTTSGITIGGTSTTGTGSSTGTVDSRSPACTKANTSAVVRKADSDGAKWAPYYQDDFAVAFPTPWVSPSKSAESPFTFDPDTYDYERRLNLIPGHVIYEFLVNNIVTDVCGYLPGDVPVYCEKSLDEHQFFLVGFTDASEWVATRKLAYGTPYTFGGVTYPSFSVESNIEASVLPCVVVYDPPTPGSSVLTPAGYSFPFGEEHDPGKNPYIPPH
ncbi:MAG: hypothetical protein ACHREM_30770 [Polyangiales bacterium]